VGGNASVGTLNRDNEACAQGPCRSAVFTLSVPEDGPYDLLATLAINATNGGTNAVAPAAVISGGGARLLVRYGANPIAEAGEHDVSGIEMSSNGSSVLTAPLGLCGKKGTKVYLAVQLVYPLPANLSALSDLTFELTIERRSNVVNIVPLDTAITALNEDWTCCGQARHVSLKLPPGTQKSIDVAVKAVGTEGLRVMARKGACPTSALADRDSGATVKVEMMIDPPPATASAAAADAVRWYVAIEGAMGAEAGKSSFVIEAAIIAAATPPLVPGLATTTGDGEEWMSTVQWYIFAMAIAMILTIIGAIVVLLYRRHRRIKPPSNALALTSDSLAYDLEMAGLDDTPTVNPLAMRSKTSPLAVMATTEQTSEAEEQLVTLIMDLQSKIDKLEVENVALKEENKFKRVAAGAMKARRVAKAAAVLTGPSHLRSEVKDPLLTAAMAMAEESLQMTEEMTLRQLSSSRLREPSPTHHIQAAALPTQSPPFAAEPSPQKELFPEVTSEAVAPTVASPSLETTAATPAVSIAPWNTDVVSPPDKPAASAAAIKAISAAMHLKLVSEQTRQELSEAPLTARDVRLSEAPLTARDVSVSLSDQPSATFDADESTGAAVKDADDFMAVAPGDEMPVLASVRVTEKPHPVEPPAPAPASNAGERNTEGASSSHVVHAFFVVCPDGSLLDVKTETQVLGRGIGGIRSKKVSREQAQVVVNFTTGLAALEMLGKNPGATRLRGATGATDWLPLHRGVRRSLAAGDEFLLLAADANAEMSTGDAEDARAQVFSLVHVPPGGERDKGNSRDAGSTG
jgi:hypothetical protein